MVTGCPLDFVSHGRCVPCMMRPLDNVSLTDGSCYIGADQPYAGGSDCRGAVGHTYPKITYLNKYFRVRSGSGHIGQGRHVQ
jgi:hypothetical protein